MAEVNLGEAIASGTNRQPERDMPITRGLQMQEQVAFRDNQAELKREAELNRRREMGAKMIGSFDPKKWHNPEYGKEFGTFLQSKTPELLDAWRKDPLEFQRKSDEVKYQLGKLQAIDNEEFEIYQEKKGSVTRPLVKKLHGQGGMPAVEEWNKRYYFSPLTFTNPKSGYVTVNDVYAKNMDSVMDDNTKKVLGKDYKQVGKLGSNPLFEMDITSPDFQKKKETIVNNLIMDKEFQKSVFYNPDFLDYYDKKLEENGIDPNEQNPDFLNKVYTDFVTDRFTSRIVPKQRMGGTPARPRGNDSKTVIIRNEDGSFTIKGNPFNYNTSINDDGSYTVGTKAAGNAVLAFPGESDGKKSTFKVINPNVKYLGNDNWQVSGKTEVTIGKATSSVDKVILVNTDDIKSTLSLNETALSAMYGYKPKPKVASPQPKDKPKKKKLY